MYVVPFNDRPTRRVRHREIHYTYVRRTALQYAVVEGRVQVTKKLLEKGVDVNVTDSRGMTPLLEAVGNRKAERLVPLLLKHKVDVFAKDNTGRNALHCLALNFNVRNLAGVAEVLIEKGVSLHDRDEMQYQPIHMAAYSGKNELVNLFLDHGANVNAQMARGETPLYLAAYHNKPAVVETLLNRGADVTLKTTEGRTALHSACTWFPQKIVIRLLVSAGADVLVEDCHGLTPFALIIHESMENESILLMIKILVLKKVRQPSIELKDERLMERFPRLLNYYRECFREIDRMKLARFIETCTICEVLSKSQHQLAALMRNPNFEIKFGQYNLNEFPIYAKFIKRAFEHAQKLNQDMLDLEEIIYDVIDYPLPDSIVREIVCLVFNDWREIVK